MTPTSLALGSPQWLIPAVAAMVVGAPPSASVDCSKVTPTSRLIRWPQQILLGSNLACQSHILIWPTNPSPILGQWHLYSHW